MVMGDGYCPECNGFLIYIQAQNKLICDCCEYEEEDAM
mgnify:CR=1 FL=1